mgnify:CR=1 FL=1
MKLGCWVYTNGDLKDAKRIYLDGDITISYPCPKCKEDLEFDSRRVPFISYGDYCHVLYCQECNHESEDKLYTLNEIGEDYVDVSTQIMSVLESDMKSTFDDCEEGDATLLMIQLEEAWEDGEKDESTAITLKGKMSPTSVMNALMSVEVDVEESNPRKGNILK